MIDRREFLKRAAILGGAAAAMTALPGCRRFFKPTEAGDSILALPASEAPIDHVVIVTMENRSFDHWLGWLAGDQDYLSTGRSLYGAEFAVDGVQQQSFPGPGGAMVPTTYMLDQPGQTNPYQGCGHRDPNHTWNGGRLERDLGFLAPGTRNDEFALGYYLRTEVPFTARLAEEFTTFDRYHCSILGPTFPNREYLMSGHSGGHKDNFLPTEENGFDWITIWEKLEAANVPCRYYYSDVPFTALWGSRLNRFNAQLSDYFEDCAAGTLPNVCMVEPTFVFGRNDDHPHADIRLGQQFARDVFRAFCESPHWQSGLFILTYDEWGGFFDHVAPPVLPDDRASTVDANNFGQAGFRVPTVMASPYAMPNYVDHRTYDHTSILRFLEWRFLSAPPEGPGNDGEDWWFTSRDRHAANIGASLRRNSFAPVRGEWVAGVALAPADPPCPEGDALVGASTFAARDGDEGTEGDQDLLHALESGYFEKVGVPVYT